MVVTLTESQKSTGEKINQKVLPSPNYKYTGEVIYFLLEVENEEDPTILQLDTLYIKIE